MLSKSAELGAQVKSDCVFQADVDNHIAMLRQKNEEMKELIAKLENEDNKPDIDEAVVTTAPLYNQ